MMIDDHVNKRKKNSITSQSLTNNRSITVETVLSVRHRNKWLADNDVTI